MTTGTLANTSMLIQEAEAVVRIADRSRRAVDGHHWYMVASDLYDRAGLPQTAKLCRRHAAERLASGK